MAYIYGLIHPNDPHKVRHVRYVGKANDVQRRLYAHIYNKGCRNPELARWVESINRTGRKPHTLLLEKCASTKWEKSERSWIKRLKEKNNLFNIRPGGNGAGFQTPETRKKISDGQKGRVGGMTGKTLSSEAKQKISKGNSGKKRTQAMREHLSRIKTGVPGCPHTRASKLKISLKNSGKKRTLTVRRKYRQVWAERIARGGYRPWNKKDLNDSLISKLYQQGLSSRRIAKQFGISTPTVFDRLRKQKVQIRPTGSRLLILQNR